MKCRLQSSNVCALQKAKNAYQIIIIAGKKTKRKEKKWAEIKQFQPTESSYLIIPTPKSVAFRA